MHCLDSIYVLLFSMFEASLFSCYSWTLAAVRTKALSTLLIHTIVRLISASDFMLHVGTTRKISCEDFGKSTKWNPWFCNYSISTYTNNLSERCTCVDVGHFCTAQLNLIQNFLVLHIERAHSLQQTY